MRSTRPPSAPTSPATRVNQFWVADHRVVDILGFNDCFQGRQPVFSVPRMDDRDRGHALARDVGRLLAQPSWKTIASALRLGMSRFGKPEVFYCDNGKDFKKVGGAYDARA
jgi:hypothetical protein